MPACFCSIAWGRVLLLKRPSFRVSHIAASLLPSVARTGVVCRTPASWEFFLPPPACAFSSIQALSCLTSALLALSSPGNSRTQHAHLGQAVPPQQRHRMPPQKELTALQQLQGSRSLLEQLDTAWCAQRFLT